MRHGYRDGDGLSKEGKDQIALEVRELQKYATFDLVGHSPSKRTTQCAEIAQKVLEGEIPIEEHEELSPEKPITEAIAPYSEEKFEAEVTAIIEAGGTTADAIRIGSYPKVGHLYLKRFLLRIALELANLHQKAALFFSHSPYATLGIISKEVPFHIPEAGCILYMVDTESGEISLGKLLL